MLKEAKNIKYGISEKLDGQMILRFGDAAVQNRKEFFRKKGIDIDEVVSSGLVHGNNIKIVSEKERGADIEGVDGLITNKKNVCLTVTVADCLPVFFYDSKNLVIGIAHAGWRGVVGNIVSNMVKKMERNFQSSVKDIEVYIGPHIKKCHFEITQELLPEFEKYPNSVIYVNDKIFIDLLKIIKIQLLKLGLAESSIDIDKNCTYCNERYFSYRRDKPKDVVSQIAYILLR